MTDEELPPFEGELNFEMKTFNKELFFNLVKLKVNSPMLSLDLQDDLAGKWYKTTLEALNEFSSKNGINNIQLNKSTVTQRDINNFIKDVKTVLDETNLFTITSKAKTENNRNVFDVEITEENITPIITRLLDTFFDNLNTGQISEEEIEKAKSEITSEMQSFGKIMGTFSFDKSDSNYFEFTGDIYEEKTDENSIGTIILKVADKYLEVSITEEGSTFAFVLDNETMSATFDDEEVMKGTFNDKTFEGQIITSGMTILDFKFNIANKEEMSGKITFIPLNIVLDFFKLNASEDGKNLDMGLKVTQAETELGNLTLISTMTSGKVEIEKPTDAEEITDIEEFTEKIQSQMGGILTAPAGDVTDPFAHCKEGLTEEEQAICMEEVLGDQMPTLEEFPELPEEVPTTEIDADAKAE